MATPLRSTEMGSTAVVATTEAEFAAHVAHQINNPLTAVIANLDVAISEIAVLARDLHSCASIEERLRDAREAAERLHRTVRELARNSSVPAWTPPKTVALPVFSLDAGRRGRVLVIDDERLIAAAVKRTLARDHEVTALGSAREAIESMRAGQRFDLILCDLMMPEMSGIEFHAELLHLASDQAARIIFLTGGPSTPIARNFLSTVANSFIEKPFDTHHLKAIVATHLTTHEPIAP
jgi:CheY-like chemotaxis protein